MGEYAIFVWSAWSVSAAVLGGLVLRAAILAQRWSKALDEAER